MDLAKLKQILECQTVPAVNRLLGSKINLGADINTLKRLFVEKFCGLHGLKLCESDSDFVIASISVQPSTEAAEFLCNKGYVVTDAGENASMQRIQTYQDESAKAVQPVGSLKTEAPPEYNAQAGPVPFKLVPRPVQYDWACPFCSKVMGEKDYSFKPSGNFLYSHTCAPDRLIVHPELEKAKAQLAAFNKQWSVPLDGLDKPGR